MSTTFPFLFSVDKGFNKRRELSSIKKEMTPFGGPELTVMFKVFLWFS